MFSIFDKWRVVVVLEECAVAGLTWRVACLCYKTIKSEGGFLNRFNISY